MSARRHLAMGLIGMLVAAGCAGESPTTTAIDEGSIKAGKGSGSRTAAGASKKPGGTGKGAGGDDGTGGEGTGGTGTGTGGTGPGGTGTGGTGPGGTGTGGTGPGGTPTGGTGTSDPGAATPTPGTGVVGATPTPLPGATPTPGTGGTGATPTPQPPIPTGPIDTLSGRVLDGAGNPLAGARVRGFEAGTTAVAARYESTSDATGAFSLIVVKGSTINLEAEDAGVVGVRTIKQGVRSDATGVELRLTRTGALVGKVTAPKPQPAGTFENVDVFVAGTAYATKTDATGNYSFPELPAGSYELTADKTGLGRATVANVTVEAAQTRAAADLVIPIFSPTILALSADHGAEGADIFVDVDDAGTPTMPFTLSFGGIPAETPTRVDEFSFRCKVPAGATNGKVLLTVNGRPAPEKDFRVVTSLRIEPRPATMKRDVRQVFRAVAVDSAGIEIASPTFLWSASNITMAADENGAITPSLNGSYSIYVLSGTLRDDLPVVVTD